MKTETKTLTAIVTELPDINGPRALVLAQFSAVVTSEEVESWVTSNNEYELPLLDDLLAVASHANCLNLEREDSIVALVAASANPHVLLLGRESCKPIAFEHNPDWHGYGWIKRRRFLLVPKRSATT